MSSEESTVIKKKPDDTMEIVKSPFQLNASGNITAEDTPNKITEIKLENTKEMLAETESENKIEVEGKEEKQIPNKVAKNEDVPLEHKQFVCYNCGLSEKYEYFGKNPHFLKAFNLLEDCYVIEDPFLPPKTGECIILGAKCVKCEKEVCCDVNCSFYFCRTYCVICAKENIKNFPENIQKKIDKITLGSK